MSQSPLMEWRRLQPVPRTVQPQLCQRCGEPIGKTRVCLVGSSAKKSSTALAAPEPDASSQPDPAEEPVYRHEHCPPGKA
jgi:hypothetical protein